MTPRSGSSAAGLWDGVDDALARQRYEAVLETIGDGIYHLDADGRFHTVNDALLEATGYTKGELLGSHVTTLFPDATGDADDTGAASSHVTTVDRTVETADGETIPVSVRERRLSEAGAVRGTIGIVQGLGAHRQTAGQPVEETTTNDLLRTVIEEVDSGVFVLDEEYRIAMADETVAQFFGLDPADIRGRDKREILEAQLVDVVDEPEDFAQRVRATYEAGHGTERFECHVTAGDGRVERWLEHRSRPIETGQYAGGRIEVYTEITDRKHSSAALAETEERFQSLADAVEEYAIFRLDRDGNVITWNEGARAIKGYDLEEIIGEHFSRFYTEEDRAANVPERNLERAKAEGSVEDEGWRLRNDGSRFWANVTITAVSDDDGTHSGFLKVTRDMTDRHRHEQELESELGRILDRISDAFFAVDEKFRFTLVNERAEEILGHPREELIGERFETVVPGDTDAELQDRFESAMATQEPVSFEREYGPLEGWIEVNAYPSDTGLSVYFQDVTARKEREQELERAFDLLDRAERIADVAGWEIDANTMDVYWSDNIFDILSIPSGEEPPLDEALDLYHPEDRGSVEAAIEKTIEDGEQFDVEARIRHGSGEYHWVRVQGIPESEGGEIVTVRGALQDITDRKERERALEASNERLEQFAYAASHDLQEPLRMVSSYLQLIENRYDDRLDEDGREFLEFAIDGADRMRDMIDGLLKYSRIESQGEPLEPVDLNGVLSDVLENLHVMIQEHDAVITTEELPRVEGDARQLRQLFQNLLTNAIVYAGEERPRIDVTTEPLGGRPDRNQHASGSAPARWKISVSDDGVGIDPADAERIFDVFQSLGGGDEQSSGIGLALCKRIVERHEGDIWVDSVPEEGATFSFTLPAVGDGDE